MLVPLRSGYPASDNLTPPETRADATTHLPPCATLVVRGEPNATWERQTEDIPRVGTRPQTACLPQHREDGHFVGEVTDPLPVSWSPDGSRLVLGTGAALSTGHVDGRYPA